MINYQISNLGIFIRSVCMSGLLVMILIFSTPSHSDSIYEECTYENTEYTKQIVQNATTSFGELEACENCLTKKLTKSISGNFNNVLNINNKLNEIPNICFLMSSVRSIDKKGGKGAKNYYYCSNPTDRNSNRTKKIKTTEGKLKDIWPRRPCLTKNYIDMTAKTFNYMANCFGYSSLNDKKNLFALFNHESSFILNNRSETGAKCYGQLTGVAIQEVEKRIAINEAYDSDLFDDSKFIYKKALKRCPDLNSKLLIDPKILQTVTDEKRIRISYLKELQKQKNMGSNTCRTSQHPYTCFFYSMYNFKINELAMNDVLNKVNEIPNKVSEKIKKDFQLPVKPLEIITVRGIVKRKKDGKIKKVNWILRNDQEVMIEMSPFDYDLQDVKIKKIDLYKKNNMVNIKNHVVLTSYNGGISVAINMFNFFIKQQKELMSYSSTCKKYPKSNHCKYRKKILDKNQSLSYEDFSDSFYAYIKENYKSKSKNRRSEVANFYQKIMNDMGYLRNERDFLSSHLKKLKGNQSEIARKNIDVIVKLARSVCPYTAYKSPDLL